MNKIDKKFNDLKQTGHKAMIPFITAGDPDIDGTIDLVFAMEEAGADIIEIGIPYSDPVADGPVIQESSTRALEKGIKIKDIINAVKIIREKSNVPLVFLVYYNCVFKYGTEKFISEAASAGIDGLIIPDLPIEERGDIIKIADKYDVYLIPLVTPTSGERISRIVNNAKGFIYCVSVKGVTGARNDIETDIVKYMNEVSKYTSLPKAIGFGISGKEMAQKLKPYCDGVIVGSAIVKIIGERHDVSAEKNEDYTIRNVKEFVADIKSILKNFPQIH